MSCRDRRHIGDLHPGMVHANQSMFKGWTDASGSHRLTVEGTGGCALASQTIVNQVYIPDWPKVLSDEQDSGVFGYLQKYRLEGIAGWSLA